MKGKEDVGVGEIAFALRVIYAGNDRLFEAERHLKRGLSILEKALGPQHRGVRNRKASAAVLQELWGEPDAVQFKDSAEADPFHFEE